MIINNPEFKKNIRQSFSYSKLIVPSIIFLITAVFCLDSQPSQWEQKLPQGYVNGTLIFAWFCAFGFFYSIVIGTFGAVNSFSDEFKQNTWDFIRMSKISARDLIFGKIVGANLPIWICTLFIILPCLAFSFYLRLHTLNELLIQDYRKTAFIFCMSLVSWITLSYMLSISIFLFAKTIHNLKSIAGVVIPVLFFNFSVGASIMGCLDPFISISTKYDNFKLGEHQLDLTPDLYMRKPELLSWYGYDFFSLHLYTMFIVYFALCSLIICCRVVQYHLQFKQKPIYWFLFCIVSTYLLNGVRVVSKYNPVENGVSISNINAGVFFLYCLALAIMLIEIIDRKKQYLTLKCWSEGNFIDFVSLSPLWLRTFIVLTIFCILNLIISPNVTSFALCLSILGLLVRDFMAMSFIARLEKVKFPLFANFLYLLIFYAFLPNIFTMGYTKQKSPNLPINNLLLPQFPTGHSNLASFLGVLFCFLVFWTVLLVYQYKKCNRDLSQINI